MWSGRRESWGLSRRVFLAGLGLVYLVAFTSLFVQVGGLFGSEGVAPIAKYLEGLRSHLTGVERLRVPTLFWFAASDAALHVVCAVGISFAILLMFGVAPRLGCLTLWTTYLSFVSVGRPFLPFQWDALLLEAGLLACLYAPGGLRPFRAPAKRTSGVIRLLFLWLLFRLMFNSALQKLASGDPVWRDLSALEFHYWTQPLPHALSYFVDRLPAVFDEFSVALMFVIELGAPILLIGTRTMRHIGLGAIVFLMVAIAATGNYGFFNLLTVVLCLPLLDDRALRALVPRLPRMEEAPRNEPSRLRSVPGIVFAVFVFVATSWSAGWLNEVPRPVEAFLRRASPLVSFNAYGLFADMTEERPEVVLEGSDDGVHWRAYEFRWKPCAVDVRPRFAGPHMPRLDWQMWFAALRGSPPPWFWDLAQALLRGSGDVLDLLGEDPFLGTPPRFVRATLYHYRFSTREEFEEGLWWARERVGAFGPTLTLADDGSLSAL